MSHDDEVCLKLGREVVRMIRDLQQAANGETGYSRRTFTYRGGGKVYVLLANDAELADLMEAAASQKYDVADAVPPSQTN